MADTIIVRCAHCGALIGEITFVPGTQRLGCPSCDKMTIVDIYESGRVETRTY